MRAVGKLLRNLRVVIQRELAGRKGWLSKDGEMQEEKETGVSLKHPHAATASGLRATKPKAHAPHVKEMIQVETRL